MKDDVYLLNGLCWECGQVFGTGIRMGPDAALFLDHVRAACPNCRSLVELPAGEYGVVDGAVRWLRQFETAEQREGLAEALTEAARSLQVGRDAQQVAADLAEKTGLRVWEFVAGRNAMALAAWLAVVLGILQVMLAAEQNEPTPPPTETTVEITYNVILPAMPLQSLDGQPVQPDGKDGQSQDDDCLTPPPVGDVGQQDSDPAASEQGQG